MRRVLLASLMVALSLGWMTAPADAALLFRVESNAGGVSVTGGPWSNSNNVNHSGSNARFTNVTNSTISWTCASCTEVGLVVQKTAVDMGIFGARIDGDTETFHDLYQAGPDTFKVVIPLRANMTLGAHTVVIRVTGTHTSPSTDNYIMVDAFEWGNAAPIPAIPGTLPTCGRTLTQNNGANVATFTSSLAPLTGLSDAYSWVWGDGTTAGTQKNPQHIYPALSSMPSGGWTATLTVTRTGDGTNYQVGPATRSCSLRVDYLNPSQSTPTVGGAEPTQDATDDSDCPTGFGWLNPLAILKILKCLFIPSSASVTSMADIWGDVTTKAPFSWAYEIVMLPAHFFDDMYDSAYAEYHADEGGTVCSNLSPGTGPIGGAEVTNCEIASTINGSSAWDAVQYVITGLFLIALAMGVYQTVVWTIS